MGFALVIWSGRRDSNSRPLAPHKWVGDAGRLLGIGVGGGVCRGGVCLLGGGGALSGVFCGVFWSGWRC